MSNESKGEDGERGSPVVETQEERLENLFIVKISQDTRID